MRILFFTFAILLGCSCITWAQAHNDKSETLVVDTFQIIKRQSASFDEEAENVVTFKFKSLQNASEATCKEQRNKLLPPKIEFNAKLARKEKNTEESETFDVINDDKNSLTEGKERFHWKPALIQSGVFLGIQHGFRMTQKKTRLELGGPFFRDWGKSVKGLRGWQDSDNFFTNYVAHPLQGGLTGRIFINNSDAAKRQEFGKSKQYWKSRFKAMVWSAVWSTQFELGPISEASLGNVGQHKKRGRNTMGWTDLVVTPVIGTGVVILEDALDRFVLKNWLERKITNKFKIRALRVAFTPTTSFANLLRLRRPAWRDYRGL